MLFDDIRRPLPERRACGNFSQPFQSSSQASQARPGRPASQASWASKPQASRHRCQQFFFIGAPARLLRPPQGATGSHRADNLLLPPQAAKADSRGSWHRLAQPGTGGQTFWHPQHQGGRPSMPRTLQISMIWPTCQPIESWDDHFMHLGYPSKFYRVQDASFIDGSSMS